MNRRIAYLMIHFYIITFIIHLQRTQLMKAELFPTHKIPRPLVTVHLHEHIMHTRNQ